MFGGCAVRAVRTLCERFWGQFGDNPGAFCRLLRRGSGHPTPGPPGLVVRRGQPQALRLRPPDPGNPRGGRALGGAGRGLGAPWQCPWPCSRSRRGAER